MNKATSRQTSTERGAAVEWAARAYLEHAGLDHLDSNARFRVGELDLVMRDPEDGSVVFVEVRYRRNLNFGGGAASVDLAKCRKLIHAAQLWLAAHPLYAQAPCRFDVVEASGEPAQFNWICNAFQADDLA